MAARLALITAATGLVLSASPALANHDAPPLPPMTGPMHSGVIYGAPKGGSWYSSSGSDYRWDAADADDWIDDCVASYGAYERDSNVEGAVIGGVIGGIAGNRIAGDGDRLLGTAIGGAAGAVAGAAIDSAEGDLRPSDEAYDYCESRWTEYRGGVVPQGHHGYGYGYGYAQAFTWVPIVYEERRRPTYSCACEDQVYEEVIEVEQVEEVRYAPAPRRALSTKSVPVSGKRLRATK
ncbi:MAG: hypothetical protein CMN30_05095 [Sandaracinus sp.]|nr:hypothetical protein [Sandaracinus sp.]